MKILFIGGTGTISLAWAQLALSRGFGLTLLNRGRQLAQLGGGANYFRYIITNPAATAAALGNERWDAVVDYIAFTPADLEQRIALFRGRTAQYIFISSASAYQKPPAHFPITESTPLANPFWDYSRNKKSPARNDLLRALRDRKIFPRRLFPARRGLYNETRHHGAGEQRGKISPLWTEVCGAACR